MSIDLEPEPSWMAAEKIRRNLKYLQERCKWYTPWRRWRHIIHVSKAIQMLLGQYAQDNKPNEPGRLELSKEAS